MGIYIKNNMVSEIKAKEFALKCHRDINQIYDEDDNLPYEYHLEMVLEIANKFIYLIPLDEQEEVKCGCWVHDVLEDTFLSYNDLKKSIE